MSAGTRSQRKPGAPLSPAAVRRSETGPPAGSENGEDPATAKRLRFHQLHLYGDTANRLLSRVTGRRSSRGGTGIRERRKRRPAGTHPVRQAARGGRDVPGCGGGKGGSVRVPGAGCACFPGRSVGPDVERHSWPQPDGEGNATGQDASHGGDATVPPAVSGTRGRTRRESRTRSRDRSGRRLGRPP